MLSRILVACAAAVGLAVCTPNTKEPPSQPNIILVMADDMGWGQTGYYDHPVLETPNLDAMAANGLRFDRFYAGAPNCSPTRAAVMTGRTNDRTGVTNHGVPMRPQERTIAQVLRQAGYSTGHFGKWHLNGLRGPGAPVLADDPRNPGAFGFDEWLSVTNFFDLDPIMSRKGTFEEFEGDSSEIIVREALEFIRGQVEAQQPFFTVIWYGSPHDPFRAYGEDRASFAELEEPSAHHYGELVAMDRSLGALREGLRDLQIEGDTLVWFTSDNGGLPRVSPDTVGGLRGYKGSVFEGGLRVPAVIEWPGVVEPRITNYPAGSVDIFPTITAIADLPDAAAAAPLDGTDLLPLLGDEIGAREQPLGFRHTGRAAWVDNKYKLLTLDIEGSEYELYDLEQDPTESQDLFASRPDIARKMRESFEEWNRSVDASVRGEDYPEGKVIPPDPGPRIWMNTEEYAPYLEEWSSRPEYGARIERALRSQ